MWFVLYRFGDDNFQRGGNQSSSGFDTHSEAKRHAAAIKSFYPDKDVHTLIVCVPED